MDLTRISRYCGMREDLIQAGGGNTSEKISDHEMKIKASGVQLSEVTDDYGFAIVDYQKIVKYLDALVDGDDVCDEKQILRDALISGMRPSIETFFHATNKRLNMHVHSVAANIILSEKNYDNTIKKLFPEALIVGYATPGLELAKLYYNEYRRAKRDGKDNIEVTFLKNHGMIISADSYKDLVALCEIVSKTMEDYIGLDFSAYRNCTEIWNATSNVDTMKDKIIYKVENKSIIDYYEQSGYRLWNYSFCPDCMVFMGKQAYNANNGLGGLDEHIAKYGPPTIIEKDQNIYIAANNVKKAKETESVLAFSAQVSRYNRLNEVDFLSESEQDFLLNWDAEKYRQQMK